MPKSKPWTTEETAKLKVLKAEGKTEGEISYELNRSIPAVHAQIVRLGLTAKKADGGELKTVAKIAAALGLSYGELISRVDNKKPLVEPKPAEVVEIKAELPEVVIEAIGAEMARLEVRIADDLKAIESKETEIKLLKEANERRFGAIKELGAFVNDND